MKELGLLINWEKSNLIPSQTAVYLGMTIDTIKFHVNLSQKRITKALAIFNQFMSATSLRAKQWQVMLGHMTSLESLTPGARLRMRQFQFYLKENWNRSTDSETTLISVPTFLKEELKWWINPLNLTKGKSLKNQSIDLILFSDASKTGWGGTLGNLVTSGTWSEAEKGLYINVLEIRAAFLCLRNWKELIKGKQVAVCVDNTTALAYINKQGGTHSKTLFLEVARLLKWAENNNVSITTQFIKGSMNAMADLMSRKNQTLPTEWCLDLSVCHKIWNLWGTPQVDLFATRWNTRLPLFCSPMRDELAWGVDALLVPWDNMFLYAFLDVLFGTNRCLLINQITRPVNCNCDLIAL